MFPETNDAAVAKEVISDLKRKREKAHPPKHLPTGEEAFRKALESRLLAHDLLAGIGPPPVDEVIRATPFAIWDFRDGLNASFLINSHVSPMWSWAQLRLKEILDGFKLIGAQSKTNLGPTLNKFLQRITKPNSQALTYDEARDWYSRLGNLSADENLKLGRVDASALKQMVAGLQTNCGGDEEGPRGSSRPVDPASRR